MNNNNLIAWLEALQKVAEVGQDFNKRSIEEIDSETKVGVDKSFQSIIDSITIVKNTLSDNSQLN